MNINEKIGWLVANWNRIPQTFKTNLGYSRWDQPEEAPENEHNVVLLLDRQKPSVESDYSFDEERIGVNKDGKIFWGFDSGCSCPSPWEDGLKCYTCANTWKEFEVELSAFDVDALKSVSERIDEIKAAIV